MPCVARTGEPPCPPKLSCVSTSDARTQSRCHRLEAARHCMTPRFTDCSCASPLTARNLSVCFVEEGRRAGAHHDRSLSEVVGRARSREGKANTCPADLGEGISVVVRATAKSQPWKRRRSPKLHREYLESRGPLRSGRSAQGRKARRTTPPISRRQALKVLTARDYVRAMNQKFEDWRHKPIVQHYLRYGGVVPSHIERTVSRRGEPSHALLACLVRVRGVLSIEIVLVIPLSRTIPSAVCQRSDSGIESSGERATSSQTNSAIGGKQSQTPREQAQHPSREVLDYSAVTSLHWIASQRGSCADVWENVDLARGTLCAVDTKNRLDHLLPMGRHLWTLLRERRQQSDSEWVFADPLTGNRITDPPRQIVNVVAKSGVPFSPHDLRRTFASVVSRLGDRLSYYTTKRLLNHRTNDVTQGYVQFDIEQLPVSYAGCGRFRLEPCVREFMIVD